MHTARTVPGHFSHCSAQVDLKVSSSQDLNEAIELIKQEIRAREQPDEDLLRFHFDHILRELNEPATANRLISLEHLELFEQYMLRLVPDKLPSGLQKQREKTLDLIRKAQAEHPRAGEARSGDTLDRPGGVSGTWAQTALKVPAGRRRQMAVILFTNLLTGPPIIALVCFLLWYFIPFSTLFFLLYFAWVLYDNKTRPMPAPSRMVPRWRSSQFYQLFRDYFPIRHTKANAATKFPATSRYLFCYHPHGKPEHSTRDALLTYNGLRHCGAQLRTLG